MPWWIALLSTMATLLSMVFAMITLARPNQSIPPMLRRQTGRFAAAMYAVRAIPLGLAMVAVVWIAPAGIATVLLLGVACVVQIKNLMLGVVRHVWGMTGGIDSGVVFRAAGVAVTTGMVGWGRGFFRRSRPVRRGPS